MILLTTAGDLLVLSTSSAAALHIQASYIDQSSGTFTPGRPANQIVSASVTVAPYTTIVGSPAGSTQRNIKELSIYNADASASNTIGVYHYDGTTYVLKQKITLQAGYSLSYQDLRGWIVTDASGGELVTPLAGRFLKSTTLTSGTSVTTGPSTNSIRARLVGGGGQGGGNAATIGCVGSGGGSGSYAEYTAAVTPNTAYSYTIGAGGSTGGTGANGQAGGNTTLVVGATTVTANGGGGGVEGTSIAVPVLGGTAGAISTNGSMNAAGTPGEPCITTGTAADNRSGAGASSQFGGGAASLLEATNATGNSAAALSYGSGGGGSATSAATARAGGAGAGGCIVIDEYS